MKAHLEFDKSLPVWVLNLAHAVDRHRFMEQQLKRHGIPFQLIRAANGKTLSSEEMLNYSPEAAIRSVGRELNRGEIGCALSHALLWERIVKEKIREVLVLEDDIFITRTFISVLSHRHRFPSDWEFINFSTDCRQIPFGEHLVGRYRACKFPSFANRTSAYLVNLKGAEKLLKHAYPLRYSPDGVTGRTDMTQLISYGVNPKVVPHACFKSDLYEGPIKLTYLLNRLYFKTKRRILNL